MTSKTTISLEEECKRLKEFKEFLREQNKGGSELSGNGVEVRTCMTRNNHETYPVSEAELHAEVLTAVWKNLHAKKCPREFKLSLLHSVVGEVELECHNAKECDFACATSARKEGGDGAQFQFDLMKLQKFVINNLEKLLTRLNDNSEMGNLKNYAEEGAICAGEKCLCSANSALSLLTRTTFVDGHIKNKPRKMEDRHICLERFSELYQLKRPYSFYGVFDGHSGSLAASYSISQLPQLLADRLTDKSNLDIAAYRDAFETSFLLTDTNFAQKQISSGTTAVCALLAHNTPTEPAHLFVAWVGDSKALLVSPSVSLQLVKSHKPNSMDERKRIESCASGGSVLFVQGQWRVNGILNVSRSIGDFSVSAVIAEPDFVDVELNASHDFLVLGTDGFWDHVEEATIVETIYTSLADIDQSVEDIPKVLIELAKQGDSQDNITVVIVFLKDRLEIVENRKKSK